MAFGSPDAGVMVGELGFLFNTQDRGLHINVVGPPNAAPNVAWNAVSMPTPTDAFAVGTVGSVAVSHDSGLTWAFLTVPVPEQLTAVQFLDAQNGFIAATNDLLFTTNNGGASWSIVSLAMTGNISALAFRDPQHGVVTGAFGQVAWTQDGLNYGLSFLDLPFTLFGAAYPAPGVVIVAGDFGALSHSLNQGGSFFDLASPTGAPIQAVQFLDHQNGFLGGGASAGTIWGTHDGAQSFDAQFSGAPSVLGLTFPDRLHGYAVGGSGTVLATDTGGESTCRSDADCADAGNEGIQCLAGACQACTEDSRCGPACQPCPLSTPTCYGAYCGACLNDLDCPADGGYCVLGYLPGAELGRHRRRCPGDGGEGGGGDGGGRRRGRHHRRHHRWQDQYRRQRRHHRFDQMGDCASDPSLCPKSGCASVSGGGAEALVAAALALVFCRPRRRRS